MKGAHELLAFNRGVVSRLALARLDLTKLKMSAEEQTNWMPRSLGSMMLRPGMGYLGSVEDRAVMIPFVFSRDDTAMIEMLPGALRVWANDQRVNRGTTSATITNGDFTSDLAGWTDSDEAGATSVWEAGGRMSLTGDGTNAAIRQQAVAIAGTATLRIVVYRGPVTLRIGSSSLASDIRRDTTLGTGTHSITVTTPGTAYVQFRNRSVRQVLVDSVAIEASGTLSLPTPYMEEDLPLLRYFQSGDVVYVACRGYQQRKIERRAGGSWSIVLYEPEDGPFRVENTTPTTLTASGLNGNVNVTASSDLFDEGHEGALFSLTSSSQRVQASFSAGNVFSDAIRVTGVGDSREFGLSISGTFSATVTLQRSTDDEATWQDVFGQAWTSPMSGSYNDKLDNQIAYYRLGIKTGNYTSGTADIELTYSSGSRTGIVRITSVSSATTATAEVLQALGSTDPTNVWSEGLWSTFRGWPSSVAIHDGRLWWAGKDRFIGSITDSYESFDASFEGDAGPISRSIGFGPVDNINWLLSLGRLIAGTDSAEISCRSSSFDEPLTPTNFTPKKAGTQGAAQVQAIEVDGKGVFVQGCGSRLYDLAYTIEQQDFSESDLTMLCPELCLPGITRIAVQRKPDTRIHCVLADGSVAVLVFDKAENLMCWVKVETAGLVEEVCVLPGVEEDAVYYVINRTINGASVRYLERWAKESECRGAAVSKLADSFVMRSGSTVNVAHLEGQTVVAWAGGQDLGEFTVSGGVVDFGRNHTNACIGLKYEARFKSTKLAYMGQDRSGLGARKKIDQLALILADTHAQGIQYGQTFDLMDDLPLVEEGYAIDATAVHDAYEQPPFTVPGSWDTDARLCLRAAAPRPCTVLAAVIDMTSNGKT